MKLFTLEADLTLNAGSFDTGVNNASTKMGSLKTEIEGVAGQAEDTKRRMDIALGTAIGDFIGKMAGALTEAVFEWAGDGIALASSMEETNAKINTIFGDSADNIHRWAKTTKDSFGIGELTAKNYAAQVAGILSTDSKNLTSEEITNISTSLVGLAGDLASFHNMNFDEVWGKLLSGLRGETEAIEALGIDLRVSNLADAFGMNTAAWGELDQRTRLLNTYQYIMQETALAQGDFARTSDSYANQMRVLEENINGLKLALGESLLPAVTELVGWFNSLFGSQENVSAGVQDVKDSYDTSIVSIENTTTKALALVEALEELGKTGEDADSSEMWNNILSQLDATLPGISKVIDENKGSITDATTALRQYVEQWRTTNRELAQMKVLQGMMEQQDALTAELVALQTEQKVGEIRSANAKSAMQGLGGQLFDYMVQGMVNMGASSADIEAMQKFGVSGAQNLLDRIAGGGSANMVMGALLEGGDLWKNKSFMQYFLAGGGSEAILSQLSALYSSEEETFSQHKDRDYASEIAEREAALAAATEEIAIAQQLLAEANARADAAAKTGTGSDEGKAQPSPQPVTIVLQATLDGQEIAATLTPKVTGAVMSNIDWRFTQIAR